MGLFVSINKIWFFVLVGAVIIQSVVLIRQIIVNRKRIAELNSQLTERMADLTLQVEKAKSATSAKSDFLSRMSHEIRTPLNAIIGMAQIAKNTSDQHKISECMRNVEDGSKHLLGIINDILDFSKIESGSLVLEEKQFSLKHDIDFLASMFADKAAEKNLAFRVELENIQHDGLTTDILRLNQVLINLLSNAIKFTDPGGVIVLSVQETAHLHGESIYSFAVRDTGVGIEPEQAKKLFTSFTQANVSVTRLYGGTGLGLAISQSIVKMMGGEIELETEPGKGSIFQFSIRVRAEKSATTLEPKKTVTPPKKLQGKRILIVDDIEINREVAMALLDGSGALVETAVNGKEAFDAFCASTTYWYDMILMDMQMPVMDGCAATIEIRNSGRPDSHQVRIIAMTANVLPEDMERAYRSGMNGYVMKPIELKVLYATMEEWL